MNNHNQGDINLVRSMHHAQLKDKHFNDWPAWAKDDVVRVADYRNEYFPRLLGYTHKTKGGRYAIFHRFMFKQNGAWFESVLYENEKGERFGRTVEDFNSKFLQIP
jgi:hypothetical protein